MVKRAPVVSLVLVLAACGDSASSSPSPLAGDAPSDPSSADRTPGSPRSGGGGGDDEGDGTIPYAHYDVNHVLSTGQSNAVGNGATAVLSTTQPYANLMFDVGVMTGSQCDGTGCKAYDKPTRFVPLVEGDRFFSYAVETMSAGLANQVSKIAGASAFDANHPVLVSVHGRSGNTYWCLRKGGCDFKGTAAGYVPPFDDAMREVKDAMELAKANHRSYVVRAVTAIHGESDHYAYSAGHPEFPLPATSGQGMIVNYEEGLLEWQRDYETSVQAITGQKEAVPLLLSQMDNYTDRPHSEVMQWQYLAHQDSRGKVVLVTPGYPLEWASDCLHYTSEGERRLGQYFAKAYARIVFEGKRWEPVRPRAITHYDRTIVIKYWVPKPPLVLDTTRVSDPGNFGFEVVDPMGKNLAIASVTLPRPDAVTITLASSPPAGIRVRYAYSAPQPACPGPKTGARGNLRDSDDTPSETGDELFNWGVHFDEPVM